VRSKFSYRCPKGHVQGLFDDRDEAIRARADLCRCQCGLRRKLVEIAAGASAYVPPEFCEHFNHSFGTVVRGRRHLRQLQEKHDCVDLREINGIPKRGGELAEKSREATERFKWEQARR